MAQPGRDVLGCSKQGVTLGIQRGNAGAVWALRVIFRLCCHPAAGMPRGNLLNTLGPMPGRISGALVPGSGVSARPVVRPWGTTGCGWHKWDTGMGQHPVPMGKQSLQGCKSQALSSEMGRWMLRFFSVLLSVYGVAAPSLLLLCSYSSALELLAHWFLVLLEAMLWFTQHQPRRGWRLHLRDRGSLLLPVPPAAAAGVSL